MLVADAHGHQVADSPTDELTLRKIVQLLHDLDVDQKRYEMRLAENREHREKLLRWLLCDKRAGNQGTDHAMAVDNRV